MIRRRPVPWFMQPIHKAHLCDALQYLADQGLEIAPVEIFGNWREVDTAADLVRANNSMAYLNDQRGQRLLIAAMGAAFLSEANDLKRPLEVVAKELGLDDAAITKMSAELFPGGGGVRPGGRAAE